MYELFAVLIYLAITAVKYCAFPLIFVGIRKAPITERNYKILCWLVNFVLWFAYLIYIYYSDGTFSIIPFIFWTKVFTSIGISKLDKKGALEQTASYTHYDSDDKNSSKDSKSIIESITHNNYCRKCGAQLSKDSVFCNKCGEKVIGADECRNELS